MRTIFEQELQRLEAEMLALGSVVEQAILDSVKALQERDRQEAKRIILEDKEVNAKRFEIESDCLTLIATQQPAAIDLRTIAAILDMATELERMHDYAKGIGKINLLMGEEQFIKPLIDIPRMAEKAQGMLHRSLLAFSSRDADMARAIPAEDDEVDALYNQVYRELFTYAAADPTKLDQANYLLWTAHNLERTADRVTNICERVVFTVSGKFIELDEDEGLADLPG